MSETLAPARTFALSARHSRAERSVVRHGPPSWRGILHEKAFAVSPALGLLLVQSARGGRAQLAAVVFVTTMTAMFAASALNHRASVGPRWEAWLRRADHTAINLFIAGTWTAVALVTLSGGPALVLSALVLGGAAAASAITIVWVRVPGWIIAIAGVGVGWSAAFALPSIAAEVSSGGIALFVAGGLFYTAGALVYTLQRPDPAPTTFGHHEIFHALVLAGAACHYVVLGLFVLP